MYLQALGADWIVASGHKMCAPTGVGFLWGRYDLLDSMPPWQGGGEMIADVFLDHSTFAPPPNRFEAGTPAIGEVVGVGAAVDYLESVGGMQAVAKHGAELAGYLHQELSAVDGVTIYGPPPSANTGSGASWRKSVTCAQETKLHCSSCASRLHACHAVGHWKSGACQRATCGATSPGLEFEVDCGKCCAGGCGRAPLAAFNIDGLHATDVSMLLDAAGVAVRSGHHCCQPLHRELGVNASARASTYLYNTTAEIDAFIAALKDSAQFFKDLA